MLKRDTLGMAGSSSSSRVLRDDQQLGLKRSCPLGLDSLGAAPRRMKLNSDEASQGTGNNGSVAPENNPAESAVMANSRNDGTRSSQVKVEHVPRSNESNLRSNSDASESSSTSRRRSPDRSRRPHSHNSARLGNLPSRPSSEESKQIDIKVSVEKATANRFNKMARNGRTEDFGVPFEHVIDYAVGFGLYRHAVLPAVEEMFQAEENQDDDIKGWRLCQWARVVHEWCGKGQVYLEGDDGVVYPAKISRVDPSSMISLASWYDTGGDKVLPISSPEWSRIWCNGPSLQGYELWQIECSGEMLGVVSVQRLDFGSSKTVIQGIRLNPKYNPLVYKRHKDFRAPAKHFRGVATWLVFHVLYLSCLYGGDGVRAEIPKHPPLEDFYLTIFSDNEWNESGHLCVSMEAQERWDVLKAGISHLLVLHQSYHSQREVEL